MTSENIAIHAYFSRIGLDPVLADLYSALYTHGPQGILQLSRHSGVERRRIYRLLDSLLDIHLIEVETHYKRSIYRAAPITNLEILLTQKEVELHLLQQGLRSLNKVLKKQSPGDSPTRVQFYRGAEGVKQMLWNETKSKTDNLSILYENMQGRTNRPFFERWAERCNDLPIAFRGIISDHFITTQQTWYAKHDNERLKSWEARYVSPEIFPITHSTVTYDDVVAYYNWKDGEIFGIELYNAQIALTQRQIFELLWQQAIPVDDLKGVPKTAV